MKENAIKIDPKTTLFVENLLEQLDESITIYSLSEEDLKWLKKEKGKKWNVGKIHMK